MKTLAKVIWILVGIVVLFAILIGTLATSNSDSESTAPETAKDVKEWVDMTYEGRQSFLETAIEKRTFSNSSEIEVAMRNAIKKETRNPNTISYDWSPSIYNGLVNVVEADSGWIHVPFKLNAKNDFGIEKELMGSATFKYDPQTNSLSVHRWEMNQNN